MVILDKCQLRVNHSTILTWFAHDLLCIVTATAPRYIVSLEIRTKYARTSSSKIMYCPRTCEEKCWYNLDTHLSSATTYQNIIQGFMGSCFYLFSMVDLFSMKSKPSVYKVQPLHGKGLPTLVSHWCRQIIRSPANFEGNKLLQMVELVLSENFKFFWKFKNIFS